ESDVPTCVNTSTHTRADGSSPEIAARSAGGASDGPIVTIWSLGQAAPSVRITTSFQSTASSTGGSSAQTGSIRSGDSDACTASGGSGSMAMANGGGSDSSASTASLASSCASPSLPVEPTKITATTATTTSTAVAPAAINQGRLARSTGAG